MKELCKRYVLEASDDNLFLEEMCVIIVDLFLALWIAWFYHPLIGNWPLSGVSLSHQLLTKVVSPHMEGMREAQRALLHVDWYILVGPYK